MAEKSHTHGCCDDGLVFRQAIQVAKLWDSPDYVNIQRADKGRRV